MKSFQYILGDKKITISLGEKQGTISEVLVNGDIYQPSPKEMPAYAAAISLALIEYEVEDIHDSETNCITIERYVSPWNNPAKQMKSLK